MKYSNNGYKTVGTSALKHSSVSNLVLVQGGRCASDSAFLGAAAKGELASSRSARPAVSTARSLACDVANRFEPLPEPVSRPSVPSSKQELAGIVACMGCIAAVLLMASLLQMLI